MGGISTDCQLTRTFFTYSHFISNITKFFFSVTHHNDFLTSISPLPCNKSTDGVLRRHCYSGLGKKEGGEERKLPHCMLRWGNEIPLPHGDKIIHCFLLFSHRLLLSLSLCACAWYMIGLAALRADFILFKIVSSVSSFP